MSSFFASLGSVIKGYATAFWSLKKSTRIIVVATLVIVTILVTRLTSSPVLTQSTSEKLRVVKVRLVSDLSLESTPLPLLGTVTSRNEATIRAEGSGRISAVYHRLGDYVGAGEIIAEFDNATERAQVLQAEGAYRSAEAGGDIATINRGSSDLSLGEAKVQAQNTINSVYSILDDVVRIKTDSAWTNPQSRTAKFNVTISDAQLVIVLEQERTAIEAMLRAREARNKTLTPETDLIVELNTLETEAKQVKNYLDDLSLALSRSLPDANATQAAIDGYKTTTGIARGAVTGALSSITVTRNALNASIAGSQVAERNSTSAGSAGISTSNAGLMSALGNLRAAEARLEKTIIRSPISGTINSLAISTGDYISPFTQVAVVSNNGALEILAYVTEDDARELAVGAKVQLENGGTGIVTRIAPALDPKTKKIEVRIGITKKGVALLNGQSVQIEATRTVKSQEETKLRIPLSALKITPKGSIVFTVSASSTLVAHPVREGTLLGDAIEIDEGLTPNMRIVVDARGLKEGTTVSLPE